MVGICLDLVLVNHISDDAHFILSRKPFQGDFPPGKKNCSPAQGSPFPLWEVVVDVGYGGGKDEGIAGRISD